MCLRQRRLEGRRAPETLNRLVVSLLFSLTSVLTRQAGALVAWVTGLLDVIVLVGLWGTPGAAEFFDPGRAPSTRAAAPVPPPPRL